MNNKNPEDFVNDPKHSLNRLLSNRDIILYTLGAIGIVALSFFLSTLFLIYGSSILGLPTFYVGVVYSISQIIYAIFLPIFGHVSDLIRNRYYSSRKPFILIGIPLLILIYHLFWTLPPCNQFGILEFITALGFLILMILYRILIAFIWAPYQATIPDLTNHEQTIIRINTTLTIFNYIGQVIGMFLPNLILSNYPYPDSASNDYYWMKNPNGIGLHILADIQIQILFLYGLFVFCFLITLYFVRVPKPKPSKVQIDLITPQEPLKQNKFKNFKLSFKDIHSRNVFVLLIANLLIATVFNAINFILMNFSVYILKLGPYLSVFTIIIVCISFSSFFLSGFISNKYGIKKAILICNSFSVISLIFMSITLFFVSSIVFLVLFCIVFLILTFLAGNLGIFFSTLISKLASTTEQSVKQSKSGNYLGLYYSFGVIGNIIAVLFSTAFLNAFGSNVLVSYLYIFLFCGGFHILVIFLIRKLQITKN